MEGFDPTAAARWIAEAIETGNPLAALPAEIAPRGAEDGAEVAAAVIEALGLVACGVRLLRRPGAEPLVGPMLETRLLASGAPVALDALRHPVVTAAVVGVLAAPLTAEGDEPPVFARLHPALDVSATRFTTDAQDMAALTADLARLGLVVAGKGRAVAPAMAKATLGPKGGGARGTGTDLAAAFAEAAAAARAWGGLPAGALLVVAGLTEPAAPMGLMRAALGGLGGAEAGFA
jgi:hypothetical protein